MPPRLNKRQQRELEELEVLKSADAVPDDADDAPVVKTGFSALFDPTDDSANDDDDANEQPKAKKSKKKKKKPATPSAESPRASTPLAKNEKKAAKKAKAKARKAGDNELDEALAELSLKYANTPASAVAVSQSLSDSLSALLSVSLQHLDAEAEMRKFFGSKVVAASKAESTSGSPSSSSRRTTTAVTRSNLTRPQPGWAPARTREGLSVRPLGDAETSSKYDRLSVDPIRGEKWWTVEYTKKYKGLTQIFLQTVQGDTLLQMAQVFSHREEHAQAVDFTDRALFAYERAFVGAFTLSSGLNRLDFDLIENRPFFLALHRQAADLQRRGCLRTTFEFCRLLYSLDPWGDPHGALFHLDCLVFKAGMTQWLLDMFKLFSDWRSKHQSDTRLNPSELPGWIYSRALVLKIHGRDAADAEKALIEAVMAFPSVVPVLADKLELTLPGSLRSHPHFKIETDGAGLGEAIAVMHLLSHLYVQRALPAWKDHALWFGDIVTKHFANPPASIALSGTRQAFISTFSNECLRYSAYRHIIVLEYRTLFRYIPRIILAQKSLDCDPLPPPTVMSTYSGDFFDGVELPTISRRQMERQLARMIPDAAARAQFEALYAVPRVAAMFPGGIMHMIQALQDMPPDLMEGMQEAMMQMEMQEGIRGEMPGQMPEEAVVAQAEWEEPQQDTHDTDDDELEEDDDSRTALAAPFRALSNWVVRGIWGTPQAQDESSDDEEPDGLEGDID